MTWDYVGASLLPDEPFDCHGMYSGSALVEDGRIRVLYTGNVKLSDADGVYDYVNNGRRADTVYVESADGQTFSPKRVVLASEDYPEDLTWVLAAWCCSSRRARSSAIMPRCVWGEGSLEVADDTCFDVIVDGVDSAFSATVDGELKLAFVPAEGELPARFEMRFTDEGRASAGCGRTVRWAPVNEVRNVRVVGDDSSVEVFVNDGALVFSMCIYPDAYGVTVAAPGASVNYHTLSI